MEKKIIQIFSRNTFIQILSSFYPDCFKKNNFIQILSIFFLNKIRIRLKWNLKKKTWTALSAVGLLDLEKYYDLSTPSVSGLCGPGHLDPDDQCCRCLRRKKCKDVGCKKSGGKKLKLGPFEFLEASNRTIVRQR